MGRNDRKYEMIKKELEALENLFIGQFIYVFKYYDVIVL